MKTNTNSKFEYADLTVASYSLLAPKTADKLPKVVLGFEHGDKKLYWSRNLHTAKSVMEEDSELSSQEATQLAKEKNKNALKGLEAVGFDKSDLRNFNPVGQVANCAIENDEQYGPKVAFVNKVFTHVKMDDEAQAQFLEGLL